MKNKFTIDIDNSINSGQVFLWKKNKNNWYGIADSYTHLTLPTKA